MDKQLTTALFMEKLKWLVQENGGNRKKFASIIGAGDVTVKQWEDGSFPGWKHISNICEKCDVTADWLLGFDESRMPKLKSEPESPDYQTANELRAMMISTINALVEEDDFPRDCEPETVKSIIRQGYEMWDAIPWQNQNYRRAQKQKGPRRAGQDRRQKANVTN